jgi:hypothetical protein
MKMNLKIKCRKGGRGRQIAREPPAESARPHLRRKICFQTTYITKRKSNKQINLPFSCRTAQTRHGRRKRQIQELKIGQSTFKHSADKIKQIKGSD